MGIQGSDIGDVKGSSVLVIEQACENSQLLVSLCRNGKQWLSPVGWTEKQKITLLDCRSQGGKTEIDIPAEFSKDLVFGDKLLLTCSELDLTQDIIWEGESHPTRPVADLSPAPTGLAGGLLSRFKSIKAPVPADIKTDAQRCVEEADLAAQSYRAKMEAATAAKEEAQRRALEAAKEAEAALKMEAERISEMERAAKAFEDAERLKQDGLRRLEEERRQEEARIAAEARRIEEARKREEAAKLEIERKAALERLESAIDVTQNEEARLQNRLTRLQADTEMLETQQTKTFTSLSALSEDMGNVQNRVKTTRTAYEKTASKLDGLNTELTKLQSKSDSASAESTALTDRVAAGEAEYLTAQREAEMAIARAEEKKRLLDAAREDKEALLGELQTIAQTLETHSGLVSETTLKTHQLESKFEAARAALDDKTAEIETLENDKLKISDSILTSRVEIEATQQALEDCHIRYRAHQKAIVHLEKGGDPENIPELDLGTRFFKKDNDDNTSFLGDENVASEEGQTSGLLGRVRRNFLRSKATEISIDVDDVSLDDDIPAAVTDEVKVETIARDDDNVKEDDIVEVPAPLFFTGEDLTAEPEFKTSEFIRRHRKSLLAIGTILGGAAILGGGFIASQPKSLSVKSSTPATSKYAKRTDEMKMPSLTAPVLTPAVKTADIMTEPAVTEKISKLKSELNTSEASIINQTQMDETLNKATAKIEVQKPVIKTPLKTEIVKKASIKKAPVKTSPVKTVSVKTVPVKKVTPKSEESQNYPALTKRVQGQLQTLGLYTGPLNGYQTQQTTTAIKTFQELYALPQHGRISGNFLSTLTEAETQHKAAQNIAAVQASVVQSPSSQAEFVTSQEQQIQFFETPVSTPSVNAVVTPAPTTAVITESLSEFTEVQSLSITEQASEPATQPSTEIVKEATAPIVAAPAQAPVVEDVVVEAQKIAAVKASYPKSAAAKNYFADVRIVVGYDVDPSGKVVNANIQSNDHSGRFNSSFEREALKAVKRLKFNAKTVNGVAVASTGKQQRIVFRGE